jgi:predicted GIY-YIG superfamily endonuclease
MIPSPSRGPWALVAYKEFSSVDEAKRRERALKNNPRMLKFFKKRALATLRVSAVSQQTLQVMG